MTIWPYSDQVILRDAISSVILLVLLIAIRISIGRGISRRPESIPGQRRRWLVNLRNAIWALLTIGLVTIWAHELRTFSVSIAAIAVALVLATKELILCASGTAFRAASDAYSVGDQIEIAGQRGVVIDMNLFSTRLAEIGPGRATGQYTGRTTAFPNSLLLTNTVSNESFLGAYVLHVIVIPLDRRTDWQGAERRLIAIARDECAPFLEPARRHAQKVQESRAYEAPSADPRVSVELAAPDQINLHLRIPSPAGLQGRLRQAILRRFLSEEPGTASPAPAGSD